MAEYYSAELAEKITRGLTENALKCKFNCGTVPIEYVINKERLFEIEPLKAPWVLEAFKWYNNGKTIKQIVVVLNEKGATTSLGSKITVNIVTNLLKNRRYIGEYRFRDIVHEDGIPQIVPKDLFNKVQKQLQKSKRAAARHKAEDDYLLTAKLYCGKCGVYMTGESRTGRNSTVHRYYKCSNAKYKHSCNKKPVKKEWSEDIVIRYTKEMLLQDYLIEDIENIVLRVASTKNTFVILSQAIICS